MPEGVPKGAVPEDAAKLKWRSHELTGKAREEDEAYVSLSRALGLSLARALSLTGSLSDWLSLSILPGLG